MDINATLHEIREILAEGKEQAEWEMSPKFSRLIELVDVLDNWMSQGDPLPDAWKDHR